MPKMTVANALTMGLKGLCLPRNKLEWTWLRRQSRNEMAMGITRVWIIHLQKSQLRKLSKLFGAGLRPNTQTTQIGR